uniref:Uncharacterized protein n=1 Tax=Rhizophora mucronata TaxID=61149 RepID=A0A2P2R2I7_RHIMU
MSSPCCDMFSPIFQVVHFKPITAMI